MNKRERSLGFYALFDPDKKFDKGELVLIRWEDRWLDGRILRYVKSKNAWLVNIKSYGLELISESDIMREMEAIQNEED